MNRADHIKALQAEYVQRQGKNRADADARLREVESKDPVIAELRARSSRIALEALKQMMGTNTPERSREIANKMRFDGIENNRLIRERLMAAGFPENYLDEQYNCGKCKDTGYTDDIPARFCECFEKELRLRMFEDGTMAGLDEQNFEHFSEELVYRVNSAGDAKRIISARFVCEQYADTYPNFQPKNILIYGNAGLGKTFLVNCIFARIISRGYSGIRITAYRMMEAMKKKHIGSFEEAQAFDELLETPLLIIDDLGTEPMYRGITIEYLFTLLNERNASGKHTIIATNLIPDNKNNGKENNEITDRYGERVSSRLTTSQYMHIRLLGTDFRTVSK